VSYVTHLLLHCHSLQFELLANGNCWGNVVNLMVNGQKHYPVYTTNYDSTGKK
jgi:hypothetical protein